MAPLRDVLSLSVLSTTLVAIIGAAVVLVPDGRFADPALLVAILVAWLFILAAAGQIYVDLDGK